MNENHQHEFPDELISAYLDGELSPAEKVRVEEQLMDSAEHRRLFEELKALRRSLQSLPAESLDNDFAARVLRRAERELLAEVPAEKPQAKESLADEGVDLRPREPHTDRGAWRGLAWSVAATAAAVGLVVFGPLFNEDTRRVSQRPAAPAEMRAAPQDQAAAPGEGEAAKNHDREAAKGAAPAEAADGEAETSSSQADLDANRAGGTANGTSPVRKQEQNVAAEGAARYNAETRTATARDSENRGEVPGALAQKDRAEQEKRQGAAEKAAVADKVADDALVQGKTNGVDGRFGQRLGGAGDALAGNAPSAAIALARDQLQATSAARAMGLVSLDVTHEALASKFFDRLLERHEIQVELTSARDKPLDDQIAQAAPADGARERYDALEQQGAPAPANIGGNHRGGQGSKDQGAGDDVGDLKQKYAEAHEDVDVMYVAATQAQIDGLLRDLQSQQGEVLAMAFDGAGLPQTGRLEEAESAALRRSRQFRELADLKELEALKAEDRFAAPAGERDDEAAQLNAVKPEAAVPSEAQSENVAATGAPADLKFDADQAGDAPRAEAKKSGFARRLSLPLRSLAQGDHQFGGGNAGASGVPLPAPARADRPAESLTDNADAEQSLEGGAPTIESAAPSPDAADEAPPAAPFANELANGRDKFAKAKEQDLVRVLFVLRAVATAPAAEAEATPADAAPQSQPAP